MLKQGLEQKLSQKLSPLQIQTIKLIETPIQELEQNVRSEWENNPVLEEDNKSREEEESGDDSDDIRSKEVSLDEIKEDDNIPGYKLKVNNWGKDERPQYDTFSVRESFTESLMEQLGYKDITEHERKVAEFLIGSLDEDGYLRRDIEALIDDLAFRANVETDEEEILRMLKLVQEFEPSGVGARDLRECLLIQLRNSKMTDDTRIAIDILTKCFDDFTGKHFQKIMSRLDISKDELKSAMSRILKLNPSPGGQTEVSYEDQAQQIIPDFVVRVNDYGGLEMNMPRFPLPEIRVKQRYTQILEDARNSTDKETRDAAVFVKQKIDSAKWYVEALKQRHNTLEKTMNAIMDFQHDYFLEGDEKMLKPMVLKDIAEITGFDISTISRVVSSKYVDTHFGIFPLKFFFSEGLAAQDGDEVSSRELKRALKDLVEGENKNKPLTDDELVEKMTGLGYKVARRTIAKYRDQLGIPKARLRKEL